MYERFLYPTKPPLFYSVSFFNAILLYRYSELFNNSDCFCIFVPKYNDILLVDEILSVGDENFREKCARKVNELRERGVTFVIVSHNMQQVKSLCQKAIWIENSEVMAYGEVNEVCDKYQKYCNEKK